MAFKFIHSADIHLDSPLLGLEQYSEDAPVDEIRGATRRAFQSVVNLAIDEQVAFVLISGDLYDRDLQDYSTVLFFGRELRKLDEADIRVFLTHGNHDAENRITKKISNLPGNLTIFPATEPDTEVLEDIGVAIHGQSFGATAVLEDLAVNYPAPRAGMFNIGMLHTSLGGSANHDTYAPTSLEGLARRGYDYWALGHIHGRAVLLEDPYIVYSGNTQGRHVREIGEKSCEVVHVDGRRVTLTRHVTAPVLWHHMTVDASGMTTSNEVYDATERTFGQLPDDGRLNCVRVEILGACQAHDELVKKPAGVVASVRQCATNVHQRIWVERVVIRTNRPISVQASSSTGPLAEVENMLHLAAEDDAACDRLIEKLQPLKNKLPIDLAEGALSVGLSSRDRVRELAESAGAELIARLQRSRQ